MLNYYGYVYFLLLKSPEQSRDGEIYYFRLFFKRQSITRMIRGSKRDISYTVLHMVNIGRPILDFDLLVRYPPRTLSAARNDRVSPSAL
jgi:hypothetical protein